MIFISVSPTLAFNQNMQFYARLSLAALGLFSSVVSAQSSSSNAVYENSTSSSADAPANTPYITGQQTSSGGLYWEVYVPGDYTPWDSVDLELSGEGFTINIGYARVGNSQVNDIEIENSGSSIEFSTTFNPETDETLILATVARITSDAEEFLIAGVLTITTPDVGLVKRAVQTFPLSNTITISSDSSETSSDVSSTVDQSSSLVSSSTTISSGAGGVNASSTDDQTTVWGFSTVTETIHGTVTSYVTYCPIETKTKVPGESDDGKATITVIETSTAAAEKTKTGGVETITTKKGEQETVITVTTEYVHSKGEKEGQSTTGHTVSTFEGQGNRVVSGFLIGLVPLFLLAF
jgi:hypothetical protein